MMVRVLPLVHTVVHHRCRFPDPAKRTLGCHHPNHVLACHLRARGALHYDREDIVARQPYLGLLAAGERDSHSLAGDFEGFWCLFDSDLVASDGGLGIALRGLPVADRRSHVRHLSAEEARTAVARFAELATESRRPDAAARLRAGAIVLELLALWAGRPEGAQRDDSPLERFRAAIERDAHSAEVSLEELARRSGLSANHLGELFRRAYGLTPVEYRARLRLARARELLFAGAQPIAEIARAAGFADSTYFARVFRRAYGVTPLRFAREQGLSLGPRR
jgi:AraC-like DNA-binding protein